MRDRAYLVLSAAAIVLAVVKSPAFPVNDPALFEYFGRAMIHGKTLYVDVVDNKLPGIYVVNAFWQRLFGAQYFSHVLAEAAVAAATLLFFALLLRRAGVERWALGTCLFAWTWLIAFPQFNFTQHYAVFFMVLGLYLHFRGWDEFGGMAVALGATFWLPGALAGVPVMLRAIPIRRRLFFLAGYAWAAAFYAALLAIFFHPQVFHTIGEIWQKYVRHRGVDRSQWDVTVRYSMLGPAIAAMLSWLVVVFRLPSAEAQRFGLVWSACMLLGFVIPPVFAEHYLICATPALAMALASFPLSRPQLVARQIPAFLALVFVVIAGARTVAVTRVFQQYAKEVSAMGSWIQADVGPGAIVYTREYLPEVQLAADAALVSPTGFLDYDAQMNDWERNPQIIVWGTHTWPLEVARHQNLIAKTPRGELLYRPVCPGRTGPFALYSPLSVAFHDCPKPAL